MSTPTPQEVADQIVGTCQDFSDATDGLDITDMSQEWLEEFDSLVMRCERCAWWVESDDVDDDQNCSECANG